MRFAFAWAFVPAVKETEWDSYDFPCMPADAQEFYKDKSFEEIVELYGLDMADLPGFPKYGNRKLEKKE